MERELLFLKPVFKEMIWGGNRLAKDFNYEIPSDHTGECWAISAHPHGDCEIIGGSYDGMHLSELWRDHRELFGSIAGEVFPLLIKIIDAKADLSIQVHPNDEYATIHENGSLGKTECWYILDCDDDAEIVIGHHAKNHDEVREMITEKRWKDFIRVIPLHKGDFFQINPGCLHAIKKGTLLIETQQNSDITYRVYDYDRLSDGKPRQLHVQQSIDVIRAPFDESETRAEEEVTELPGGRCTRLIRCPYYTVEKLEVAGKLTTEFNHPFTDVSVIDGAGSVDGYSVVKGSHFIVPSDYGPIVFEGTMELICSAI